MSEKQNQSEPIRRLTRTLLLSGLFNVFLVAFLFYFLSRETVPRPYCESKPAKEDEQLTPLAHSSSNKELIKDLRTLSMPQLIAFLTDTQLVENGYTQRDLALSALVTFYHFDLNRALLGKNQVLQERKMPFGKNRQGHQVEIVVYPGMTEEQFQAIVDFAKTERWPLTSRGLFLQLRKQKEKPESNLMNAFVLTPEFAAIETLFSRSDIKVKKEELFKLLCEGNWKSLAVFYENQKKIQDLSPAKRQQFLLDYIGYQSKTAAYLLLKTDGIFAVTKLDDARIISILGLLDEKTVEAEKFSLILLTSPRGDAVRQAAALRLYAYAGEPAPVENLHLAALTRFIPQPNLMKVSDKMIAQEAPQEKKKAKAVIEKPKQTVQVAPTSKPLVITKSVTMTKPASGFVQKKPQVYTVQEGDSLWKISRKFKVDVEVIKKLNKLESDLLKPGTVLRLPS